MEIKLKPKIVSVKRNVYVLTINTIQGHTDDHHKIKLEIDTIEELREIIIGLTLLIAAYPEGKGGFDRYYGKFFEEYIKEELYYYEGVSDFIQEYSIVMYDDHGVQFNVEIIMDDEMKRRINAFDGLTDADITAMNFRNDKAIIE